MGVHLSLSLWERRELSSILYQLMTDGCSLDFDRLKQNHKRTLSLICVFYAEIVFCQYALEFVAGLCTFEELFLSGLDAYPDDFVYCRLGFSFLLSFFDRVCLLSDCLPVSVHLAYHLFTLLCKFVILSRRPLR